MIGNKPRGIVLQERDRHLLKELGHMRVIDREQAKQVAGFHSTTRANTRLLALTRAGLLRRFFMGTEAGGKQALYTLSREGAQLAGATYQGLRRRENEVLVADFFVTHQLAINQIYSVLKYFPIPVSDCRFLRFVTFHEPVAPGASLLPDGYVEIRRGSEVIAAFLEVDLGNESVTVWRKKVNEYLSYAVSGLAKTQWGPSQFRVLVIADHEQRMNSLRRATAGLTEKIFWFTSFEAIREGFWSPIWLRPKEDVRQPLLGTRS